MPGEKSLSTMNAKEGENVAKWKSGLQFSCDTEGSWEYNLLGSLRGKAVSVIGQLLNAIG